jgi:Protein of unknown function (DUF3089)
MYRWTGLLVAATTVACAHPAPVAPAGEQVVVGPMDYERPESWLCRPDLPTDACRGDLDATELRPDGSRVVVPFVPAAQPKVDCFYVYPTVDLKIVSGNHTDFSDTGQITETTRAQVARFGEACRIFAPFYKQMTFGTYFSADAEHERHFEIAFTDVVAAFRWYLAHADATRRIVLVGHSQGAQMIERLLRTQFDGDASLRARLLVAMPIGGDVAVADGSDKGGTFQNIPLCTTDEELGCVVAYNTFRPAGVRRPWPGPPPAGDRSACVNPGDVATGAKHPLSLAVFPTHSRYRDAMPGAAWAKTPFIALPGFYDAWCADGQNGFRFLAVEEAHAPGDIRESPIDLTTAAWRTKLGLHLLDMQFAQGDLVRLIERKAAVK